MIVMYFPSRTVNTSFSRWTENIDRNIAFRPDKERDIEDVSEQIIMEDSMMYGGLESKLIQARSYYESQMHTEEDIS